MNPDEVSMAIAKVVSGLQIAFIHLGNVLEQRNVILKSELATTFEATANLLPDDLISKDISQKILNGIAIGLRDSSVPVLNIVH